MGIDKETSPSNLWISFPNKPALIKSFKANADEYMDKDEGVSNCLITEDIGNFEPDEYYLDGDNIINFSGEIHTPKGSIYLGIGIQLTDTILIDILQHSIKKLNKLKLAMETLK